MPRRLEGHYRTLRWCCQHSPRRSSQSAAARGRHRDRPPTAVRAVQATKQPSNPLHLSRAPQPRRRSARRGVRGRARALRPPARLRACVDPPASSCSCEHGVPSPSPSPSRPSPSFPSDPQCCSTSRRNFQRAGPMDEEPSPIAVRPSLRASPRVPVSTQLRFSVPSQLAVVSAPLFRLPRCFAIAANTLMSTAAVWEHRGTARCSRPSLPKSRFAKLP
jgi:hypothetical protein